MLWTILPNIRLEKIKLIAYDAKEEYEGVIHVRTILRMTVYFLFSCVCLTFLHFCFEGICNEENNRINNLKIFEEKQWLSPWQRRWASYLFWDYWIILHNEKGWIKMDRFPYSNILFIQINKLLKSYIFLKLNVILALKVIEFCLFQ